MKALNLPAIDCNIRKNGANVEIFDIIRKKYIVLTHEEWVRQHFIHFLIKDLSYPKSLFRIESGLRYNKLAKRSDILIFDNQLNPLLLVECKSPMVVLNQKGLDQVSVYNSQLKAKYVVLTNGMKHFCCVFDSKKNKYSFLNEIPAYK